MLHSSHVKRDPELTEPRGLVPIPALEFDLAAHHMEEFAALERERSAIRWQASELATPRNAALSPAGQAVGSNALFGPASTDSTTPPVLRTGRPGPSRPILRSSVHRICLPRRLPGPPQARPV